MKKNIRWLDDFDYLFCDIGKKMMWNRKPIFSCQKDSAVQNLLVDGLIFLSCNEIQLQSLKGNEYFFIFWKIII